MTKVRLLLFALFLAIGHGCGDKPSLTGSNQITATVPTGKTELGVVSSCDKQAATKVVSGFGEMATVTSFKVDDSLVYLWKDDWWTSLDEKQHHGLMTGAANADACISGRTRRIAFYNPKGTLAGMASPHDGIRIVDELFFDLPPQPFSSFMADSNYFEDVKYHIAKGVDINAAEEDGRTLIFTAASVGNLELTQLLLERGANVNTKLKGEFEGLTPLHMAIRWPSPIAELLIDAGANVNPTTKTKWRTPLKTAQEENKSELAALLKARGAK